MTRETASKIEVIKRWADELRKIRDAVAQGKIGYEYTEESQGQLFALEKVLNLFEGDSIPAPKAEPWYPPKPDSYGPWIERKDGDPIPNAPEVIGLTNAQRSHKWAATQAPSGVFWWNSAAKGGRGNHYICAYAIKES
jgi:hypothetical protein